MPSLPPYGSLTSPEGAAISTVSLQVMVGNALSPESFFNIFNATDFSLPTKAEVVDVTNYGDLWRRRIPTLLDMGEIKFKCYWVMTDLSLHNGPNSTAWGVRYMLVNRLLRDWEIVYPDGYFSTDAFPAYVTSFEVTGTIAKTFEANTTLSNSGEPTLV